ncbi:hypothetical protein DINM_001954 [Dirofilaria immitis]|nr:hypothetical protein [Dirofilaria immitis]
MPGLFSSWKPRFRTRKTSDSERSSTSSSIPPFLHSFSSTPSTSPIIKRLNKRAVHFHENGLANNRDGAMDWKYIDDNKAPLASDEADEMKNEMQKNDNQFSELSSSQQNTRITITPEQQQQQQQQQEQQQQKQKQQQQHEQQQQQQLNDNLNGTKSDDEIHLNGVQSVTNRPSGVVYLELNDEVKRALLPSSINSIDTVRALFLRSFPQLTSQYLSLPYVKIYIQEPSKGQLFTNLMISDIKDQAVLKLREKSNNYQSSQSNRFLNNHSSLDYLSESEIDLMDYRNRMPPSHRYRPASALDSRMLSTAGTIKSTRSPISSRFDSYCDPYASDTSSQERSGSVTPIIDKEARFRVETMERQLAGLSSLVHSALISKGMSETSQRDMEELRKQILALHPDVASIASESSVQSTDPSLNDSVFLSNETQQQILKFKRHITEMQNQLKQIEMNVHESRDILREAFERVHQYVANYLGATPYHSSKLANDTIKSEHIIQIANLQKSLQIFEENVEEIRHLVLNTNRKLRMTEVEAFTETLTRIGRNAAKLKTQFPTIQYELQKEIKTNMERIVSEEKFIKEETAQIDQCLRRCKTLANMMVTMKKLAMVQDPTLNTAKLETKNNNRTLFTLKENEFTINAAKFMVNDQINGTNRINEQQHHYQHQHQHQHQQQQQKQITDGKINEQITPPLIPPPPLYYESTSSCDAKRSADANVLDTILDELTNTVQRDMLQQKSFPCVIRNGPPKPPERHSTTDVRNRFMPSEIHELQRRAIESVSPSPGGRSSLPTEFEGRQEKLIQKQRQLHSQFEQLQQMCAPSNII